MNKSLIKTLLLSGFVVTAAYADNGEDENKKSQTKRVGPQYGLFDNISLTVRGGANFIFGDAPSFDFARMFNSDLEIASHPRKFLGAGFGVSKQISHILGIGGNFNFGQLSGVKTIGGVNADVNTNSRYFQGNFQEITGFATVNLSSILLGPDNDRRFNLHGQAGYGLILFRAAQFKTSDDSYLGGEGYVGQPAAGERLPETRRRTREAVIPVGISVQYRLTESIDLGIEQIVGLARTDKLDALVGGGPYDSYTSTYITLTYNIGKPNGRRNAKWDPAPWAAMWLEDAGMDTKKEIEKKEEPVKEEEEIIVEVIEEEPVVEEKPPVVEEKAVITDRDGRVILTDSYRLQFEYKSAELTLASFDDLDRLAKHMKDHPNCILYLDGHTDNIGGEAYNMGLSKQRAIAAKNYMVSKHKISSSRIKVNWHGLSQPIATNDTEEGRAMNRRTELKVECK